MTRRCSLAAAAILVGGALVGSAVASAQTVSPTPETRSPHLRAEDGLIQARSRAEAASIAYEHARRERDRLVAEIELLEAQARDAAAALERANRAGENAAQTVGTRRGLVASAFLSELRMQRGAPGPAGSVPQRQGIASWIAAAERDAAGEASGRDRERARAHQEAEVVAAALQSSRSRLAMAEASLEAYRMELIEAGVLLHETATRHDAMVRFRVRRGHRDEDAATGTGTLAAGDVAPDAGRTDDRPSLRFPVEAAVLQRFGERRGGQRSRGVVLRVERPQPVVAPGRGRVAFASSFRGLGPLLIIDHGHDYHSLVIGASRLEVEVGDIVDEGRVVGWLDGTAPGSSELYLELRKLGEPIDPFVVVTVREGEVRG